MYLSVQPRSGTRPSTSVSVVCLDLVLLSPQTYRSGQLANTAIVIGTNDMKNTTYNLPLPDELSGLIFVEKK